MKLTEWDIRTLIMAGAREIADDKYGLACSPKDAVLHQIDRLRQLAEALSEPTDGPA